MAFSSKDNLAFIVALVDLECSCFSGTRATESHLRSAGWGQSQEEAHCGSGPRDPHPEWEHQHFDQGAGTQGQRGFEDP